MLTIARLFGKSPFAPLKLHMEKVVACVDKLQELLTHFQKREFETLHGFVKQISDLEYQADLAKQDLRNHLPRSLFLPIDRIDILDILHLQDSIADIAEEISKTVELAPLDPTFLSDTLDEMITVGFQAFEQTKAVFDEFDNLLESSFGGMEAEKVKEMIENVAKLAHTSSLLKQRLIQKLFEEASSLEHQIFYLWVQLIDCIARFTKLSEKLSHRIRTILDVS